MDQEICWTNCMSQRIYFTWPLATLVQQTRFWKAWNFYVDVLCFPKMRLHDPTSILIFRNLDAIPFVCLTFRVSRDMVLKSGAGFALSTGSEIQCYTGSQLTLVCTVWSKCPLCVNGNRLKRWYLRVVSAKTSKSCSSHEAKDEFYLTCFD